MEYMAPKTQHTRSAPDRGGTHAARSRGPGRAEPEPCTRKPGAARRGAQTAEASQALARGRWPTGNAQRRHATLVFARARRRGVHGLRAAAHVCARVSCGARARGEAAGIAPGSEHVHQVRRALRRAASAHALTSGPAESGFLQDTPAEQSGEGEDVREYDNRRGPHALDFVGSFRRGSRLPELRRLRTRVGAKHELGTSRLERESASVRSQLRENLLRGGPGPDSAAGAGRELHSGLAVGDLYIAGEDYRADDAPHAGIARRRREKTPTTERDETVFLPSPEAANVLEVLRLVGGRLAQVRGPDG